MTKTTARYEARPMGALAVSGGELAMAGLFYDGHYVTTFYGDTADEAMAKARIDAERMNMRVRYERHLAA